MHLRKVRDEAEARSAMAAVAASGLPRPVWARRHGISPRSLNAWRLNLARRPATPPPLRLVEITPFAGPAAPTYTLRIGDLQLELADDFREDTLRRLLGVLRSC